MPKPKLNLHLTNQNKTFQLFQLFKIQIAVFTLKTRSFPYKDQLDDSTLSKLSNIHILVGIPGPYQDIIILFINPSQLFLDAHRIQVKFDADIL